MKLQQRLDRIREGFEKRAPPEVLAVMHRATEDLRRSGIAGRALKEGLVAPAFELRDSAGRSVGLGDLLKRGPVVLTFFRGHW
jgi:hypothetical protein